ncbi:MAG: T9SS type A sorting domain-containing protein [Bacteroidia bacterium]
MKKIILFLSFIIIGLTVKAQSGATCATAIPLVSTDSCINNDTLNTEMWFSFVADRVILQATSKLITGSVGKVITLEMYSVSCSGLTLVNQISIDSTNDSILVLKEYNLNIGNTYYIRAYRASIGCRSCIDYAVFNFCMSKSVLSSSNANCGLNPGPITPPACNILCNGDFNTFWTCPDNISELANTYCWNIDSVPLIGLPGNYDCLEPNGGSPDYFHLSTCPSSPANNSVGVPVNFAGTENSHLATGGYAGIYTYDKNNISLPGFLNPSDPGFNYREYIQQRLTFRMIVGKKYKFSMYVSLADSSAVGNYVGTLFSTTAYDQSSALYINKTPQFETPTIVTNKVGWTQYDTTFVADSAYRWIVIGNFRPDAAANMNIVAPTLHTTHYVAGFGVQKNQIGYYYLDDISVTPLDSIYTTVSDADSTICNGSTVTLHSGLSVVQPLIYSWTSFPVDTSLARQDTMHIITVNPHVTTTYYVEIIDVYGCRYHDTTKIKVIPLPPMPKIVGDSFSCVVGTPIPYAIANYDTTLTYSASLIIGTGGTISPIDSTGHFTVTWSNSNGDTILVSVGDSIGCDSVAKFYVRNCCKSTDTTFINDSATLMLSHYGIAGSTVPNKTFSINGLFTIDHNIIWKGCTVTLGADAKILVLAPYTLDLTAGATITHLYACGPMWDKIEIESGATLIADKNTLIEDAKAAVYSVAGGNYQLNGVHLNRNLKHMVLTPYTGVHPGLIENSNLTCQAISSALATLAPPYTGYRTAVGIEINSVKSVTIGVSMGAATENNFKNMNIGISATKSIVTVYGNNFRNITAGAAPNTGIAAIKAVGQAMPFPVGYVPNSLKVGDGTALHSNTINNCANGIVTDVNMNVSISLNSIKNISARGIYIRGNKALNTVNITKDTITNFSTGIFCELNNLCTTSITLNKINSPAITASSTGIALAGINSTHDLYTIYNNDIDKVSTGVLARSETKAVIDGNRINVRPITLLVSGIGVFLSNNIGTSVTTNIIQCIPATTTNTNVKGVFVQDSPNTIVKCNEAYNFGASIHFDGPANTFGTVFNNLMKNGKYALWLSNGVALGNQGGPAPTGVASDNKWQGTFTAHTFLSGGTPTIGNNSRIFYRSGGTYVPSLNSSVPSGVTMVPLVVTATNLPSICSFPLPPLPGHKAMQLIAQDSVYTTHELKWLSKHAVYRELKTDSTLIAGDTILSNFENTTALQNTGKLYDALEMTASSDVADYTTAQSTLSLVMPSDNIEDYLKTVLNLALQNAMNGIDFDSTELSTLRDIAGMCPYSEGTGVYLARSLVMSYDPEGTEYQNSCEIATDRSMSLIDAPTQETAVENNFVLYPNPNNGEMTLNYKINEQENGNLIIYDITGRQINSYKLTSANNSLIIKENELSNGIYLYKIVIGTKTVKSDRLVIIK